MKTYELARALNMLAKFLKSMPNQDVSDLELNFLNVGKERTAQPESEESAAVVGIHTLANLSKIDKKEWLKLIEDHGFPIAVRPRDASRDIIGKLLNYLDKNPAAQREIKKSAESLDSTSSHELSKALSILMGED